MKHSSISNDFQPFINLLRHWNLKLNLVARGDEEALGQRHIEDSLQLAPLIPARVERGIDLGSGAGFPGLILAKATGTFFDLIEADHRKAAFLREAVRLLDAPAQVHVVRIEEAEVEPASLVVARALAPLRRLLPLTAPLLAPGGTCLFPKGAQFETELTEVAGRWQMNVDRIPSRTPPGVILRITELQRVTTRN